VTKTVQELGTVTTSAVWHYHSFALIFITLII